MKNQKVVRLNLAEQPYAVYAGDQFVARMSNLRAAAIVAVDRAHGDRDLWRVEHNSGASWGFATLMAIAKK
jgi:hypothetical protein